MIASVQDSISFMSKLSRKRLSNAFQVWRSYQKSQFIGKAEIRGLPFSLAIEPTTACNLRCPECPSGLRSFTRATGKLDSELFKKIIDELAETLIYLTFYFQGEPYLHPHFLEMVAYAGSKNIYTSTSTNAHFLSEKAAQQTIKSGLNRLIISIDGASQKTYESYRKMGSLEKVLQGTRNMVETKKKEGSTIQLIWQYLVVKPNEHEIPKIKQMAKEVGIDLVIFKTAQIYDYENGHELIPTQQKYARYRKLINGRYKIKNELKNKCWKMWHSSVITWDGQVLPCCFDKDAKHAFGSISQSTFQEVWNSDKYNNFRQAILNSRSGIDICKNCTEGLKVWAS